MTKSFPSKFSTPEHSPGFLLWQLSNLWQKAQREALSDLELTHVQFVLLAVAAWHAKEGIELTQVKLAERAKTDPMMTSQVMRTLESRGLVTREKHPVDTRALVIGVTSEGKKLVCRAIPVVESVDQKFFGSLGKRDAGQFRDYLAGLISAGE